MNNIEIENIINQLKTDGEMYDIKKCIDLCKILYKKNLFYKIKEIYEDFLNKGLVESIYDFKYGDKKCNQNINQLKSIFYLCSFKWKNN